MTVEKVEAGGGVDVAEVLHKAMHFTEGVVAEGPLVHGSDVELAERAAKKLRAAFGHDRVVHCEGAFYIYNGRYWEAAAAHELRRLLHKYDGAVYGSHNAKVRLGKGRLDSIEREWATILTKPGWFDECRVGINCLNGFIEFGHDGVPILVPHDPDHRQRHMLQAEWHGPVRGFEGSLLNRLLTGCFEGDADAREKRDLCGELAAAAALGYGPRLAEPKAAVFLGRLAFNGKSQLLALYQGLLPRSAVVSVPPSKFSDERYVIRLAGKLLNTSDELGTAGAISSDTFKYLVTGEPVSARDLYKSVVDFRGVAQHVFACNQLPSFQGGMDRGVLRRLLVLVFNRRIPPEEQVVDIGLRVLREELPLVLSWVVASATRLVRQGRFTVPPSSEEALMEWTQGADPVQGWIAERTKRGQNLQMLTKSAYADFQAYATVVGAQSIAMNTFSQRLKAAGFQWKHSGGFNGFVGVGLRGKVGDVW
jgi:phage/plasmid-associated DNA primase